MKNLLIILVAITLSNQALATVGISCETAGHDITSVYADPYVGIEFGANPPVHTIYVDGVEVKKDSVSVTMAEYNTNCEVDHYEGPGCRLYMKVDLNGNGKFEFEYEVWRQLKDVNSDEGGVEYYGRMIDYRKGVNNKTTLDAFCSISN